MKLTKRMRMSFAPTLPVGLCLRPVKLEGTEGVRVVRAEREVERVRRFSSGWPIREIHFYGLSGTNRQG
jgi:hypothetical protein